MDGSPCNIKAPCLAMPTVPLLSAAPAPPCFPAIGSSLKVTLQSGRADVAGLAAGMEPAPTPLSLSHPLPTPPHCRPHLKDAAPTPLGQVSAKIHTACHSGAPVKNYPTSLINKGPFLMQTL